MYCVCPSGLKLFHPTANGNMDGADLLAGTEILNFINICTQQTPIYAPH
jgi:hypothetical protein